MPTLTTNDRMVERVFRAMTIHKPSFAAVLSVEVVEECQGQSSGSFTNSFPGSNTTGSSPPPR